MRLENHKKMNLQRTILTFCIMALLPMCATVTEQQPKDFEITTTPTPKVEPTPVVETFKKFNLGKESATPYGCTDLRKERPDADC